MQYHYVKCAGCGELLKRAINVKETGKLKPRCFECKRKMRAKYFKRYKKSRG